MTYYHLRRQCGCAVDCFGDDTVVELLDPANGEKNCCEHCPDDVSCFFRVEIDCCWPCVDGELPVLGVVSNNPFYLPGSGNSYYTCTPQLVLQKLCTHGCRWVHVTDVNLRSNPSAAVGACNRCALSECYPDSLYDIDYDWVIDVNGPETAVLYNDSYYGGRIEYTTDEWKCLGGATFTATEATRELCPAIPERVCVKTFDVTSIAENRRCESHEKLCECCDPGTCQSSIFIRLAGCEETVFTFPIQRHNTNSPDVTKCNASQPAALPCGTPIPAIGTLPCGAWRGSSGGLDFALWCTGPSYHMVLTCTHVVDEETVCEVLFDGVPDVLDCRCDGMYIEFNLPENPCLGCTVTVPCCFDPIPTVLTAEIYDADANANCSIANGTTFTLTYNPAAVWGAGTLAGWEGTATSATGTFRFVIVCMPQWIVFYETTCGQLQPSLPMTAVCVPFMLTRALVIRPNATPTIAVNFSIRVTL